MEECGSCLEWTHAIMEKNSTPDKWSPTIIRTTHQWSNPADGRRGVGHWQLRPARALPHCGSNDCLSFGIRSHLTATCHQESNAKARRMRSWRAIGNTAPTPLPHPQETVIMLMDVAFGGSSRVLVPHLTWRSRGRNEESVALVDRISQSQDLSSDTIRID